MSTDLNARIAYAERRLARLKKEAALVADVGHPLPTPDPPPPRFFAHVRDRLHDKRDLISFSFACENHYVTALDLDSWVELWPPEARGTDAVGWTAGDWGYYWLDWTDPDTGLTHLYFIG